MALGSVPRFKVGIVRPTHDVIIFITSPVEMPVVHKYLGTYPLLSCFKIFSCYRLKKGVCPKKIGKIVLV